MTKPGTSTSLASLVVVILFSMVVAGCIAQPAATVSYTNVPPPPLPTTNEDPAYAGTRAFLAIDSGIGFNYVPMQGTMAPTDINLLLAKALIDSGRFKVVVRDQMSAFKTFPQYSGPATTADDADLLISATVTNFSTENGPGGWAGIAIGLFGIPTFGVGDLISKMTLEVQVTDARTSQAVLKTEVKGSSTDFNSGLFGFVASGMNTANPAMQKVLAVCLEKVVLELQKLPEEYFRH